MKQLLNSKVMILVIQVSLVSPVKLENFNPVVLVNQILLLLLDVKVCWCFPTSIALVAHCVDQGDEAVAEKKGGQDFSQVLILQVEPEIMNIFSFIVTINETD